MNSYKMLNELLDSRTPINPNNHDKSLINTLANALVQVTKELNATTDDKTLKFIYQQFKSNLTKVIKKHEKLLSQDSDAAEDIFEKKRIFEETFSAKKFKFDHPSTEKNSLQQSGKEFENINESTTYGTFDLSFSRVNLK